MEELKIGDTPINVLVANKESDKTPLVFIHMSWGSSAAWMMYIKYFSSLGYPCYALDLRGHGQSGGSVIGATMESYAEDVREVISNFHLNDYILIGHSMGGLIALLSAKLYGARGVVAIDASPSAEVQDESIKKEYPPEYTPMDAGMPTTPEEIMKAFPDITPEMLMKLKDMLGKESGVARSERKLGVSVRKESLKDVKLLFIGAELGASVPVGIGIEKAKKEAEYYGAPVIEIKGATHPGLLVGEHWEETASAIKDWINEESI